METDDGREGRGQGPAHPLVSVRDAMAAAAASPGEGSPGEPRAAARLLATEGGRWEVRVLGASRAGPRTSAAPVLLLGFRAEGDEAGPWIEAVVVARSLDAVTDLELEEARRGATAPRTPWEPRPLFPEIASRGTRDG